MTAVARIAPRRRARRLPVAMIVAAFAGGACQAVSLDPIGVTRDAGGNAGAAGATGGAGGSGGAAAGGTMAAGGASGGGAAASGGASGGGAAASGGAGAAAGSSGAAAGPGSGGTGGGAGGSAGSGDGGPTTDGSAGSATGGAAGADGGGAGGAGGSGKTTYILSVAASGFVERVGGTLPVLSVTEVETWVVRDTAAPVCTVAFTLELVSFGPGCTSCSFEVQAIPRAAATRTGDCSPLGYAEVGASRRPAVRYGLEQSVTVEDRTLWWHDGSSWGAVGTCRVGGDPRAAADVSWQWWDVPYPP